MWIEYGEEADVLYMRLDEAEQRFSNEVFESAAATVVFDVDAAGRIAAIEILGASRSVNLVALAGVLRRRTPAPA